VHAAGGAAGGTIQSDFKTANHLGAHGSQCIQAWKGTLEARACLAFASIRCPRRRRTLDSSDGVQKFTMTTCRCFSRTGLESTQCSTVGRVGTATEETLQH
jgi:hypothetical protein